MFKKIVSPLLVAATLSMGVSSPQPAQAGIILAPFLVGIVLIVVGVEHNDLGLVILGEDGNVSRDKLAAKISEKYGIEDQTVATQLADTIRAKAAVAQADAKGVKTVDLSREEVLSVLAPTGLDVLNPSLVEKMVADFGPNS